MLGKGVEEGLNRECLCELRSVKVEKGEQIRKQKGDLVRNYRHFT